jgi:hypothetical protein
MLTPVQAATLKADINANPILAAMANNPDTATAIAAQYNQTASPDFWVWRSRVTKSEMVNATTSEGTVFAWTGAGFITRSQGERDAFRELFSASDDSVNPSLPQVRQAFLDIFSGTGAAASNRAHLAVVSRRKATAAEKLYAVNGAGTTGNPSTMGWEGMLTFSDVMDARSLP